jgi:hypothetical protein
MGADLGTNFEQFSSMFRITYSGGTSDGRTSDNFSIDGTASNWLWWWYRYFMENEDYKAYCLARSIDDSATCDQLESQFERIAELYRDWGDIHALKTMHRNEMPWKAWLYERRHLFFVDVPQIRPLTLPAIEIDRGAVAMQMPATATKDEILRLFAEFVDKHYSDLQVVYVPKYQLHAPQGRIDQSTYQTIKKAYYAHKVSIHHVQYPESNAGTALEIMTLELKTQLGFNWQLEPDQERRLQDGTLSMMDLDSVKRQVGRFKTNFSAYVSNTIHGVFPKQ